LWRNAQGSFNNAMYEAWSIGYEGSLIAGNVYNADGVLKTLVDPGDVQPVQTNQVASAPAPQPLPVVTTTPPVVTVPEPRVPQDRSAYRYTRSVEPRNIDPSSHHPPPKVKGTSVPAPTPPSEKQRDRTVFQTSFQLYWHMSTLTGTSYHSSGGSSPSSGDSDSR
jgi:hypothetical protein